MLYFPKDQLDLYDPFGVAFINLNPPEDFKPAEGQAKDLGETAG